MRTDKAELLGSLTVFAGLDQVSKTVAVAAGAGVQRNPGVTLGFGGSMPEPLWIAVSAAALLFVLSVGGNGPTRSRLRRRLCGAIAGGVVGNLVDRIWRGPALFHGAVVDWLHIPGLPVTNLADLMLRLGVASLISYEIATTPAGRRSRLLLQCARGRRP